MTPGKFARRDDKEDLEDFAYRSLINMIVENKFRPGDAILETEMAKLLKISRTPLRQALGRLVTEGLLEKRRKKGCIIPLPHPEDARQVFHARQALEVDAIELACLNATDADINGLKEILEVENKAISSYDKESYWWANENFHFAIFKAARNVYVERYCRHIFWRSSIYIFFFDSFYSQNKREIPPSQLSPFQHPRILKAIEDRDAVTAGNEMKEHIQTSFQVFLGS